MSVYYSPHTLPDVCSAVIRELKKKKKQNRCDVSVSQGSRQQQGTRHSELPIVLQVVGTERNSLEEAGEEKDVNARCRLVRVEYLSQDWTVSKSDEEVDFRQVER